MQNGNSIAVDFGTTNSYFCKCPSDQLSPVGIDFGAGRDGLPTAVLYRRDKEPLIGHWALHEYGEAVPQERRTYRLCTQFKPDIAVSREARQHAEDFLSTVLRETDRLHIALNPTHNTVIFGVPSESAAAFKQTLGQIAEATGFGRIRMIDEPKGALLYHLWHKDFSPSEAQQGVLVVDFGGGTCDFAVMNNLEVNHSWGDMELGGRLFDDLFYQWFIEQNPAVEADIQRSGDFYYVYAYLCREAKEFFSLTMARDRAETVNKSIGRYGALRDMTWDAFVRRAGAYRPSDALKDSLAQAGVTLERLDSADKPMDLLDWFKSSLQNGLTSLSREKEPIGRVILAGGSSQWPFVPETISEVLALDRSRLMRSDRPYAAISEGLAILPALQRTFAALRTTLKKDLPAFCEDRVRPLLREVTDTYAEEVATDITVELFDRKLQTHLRAFREEGGSVASLRQKMALDIEVFSPSLETLMEQRAVPLKSGLADRVKSLFAQWLGSYGLSVPEASLAGDRRVSVGNDFLHRQMPDLYGGLVDTAGWFVVAAVSGFGGAVAGGAGTAVILSGPVGWMLGAVLAGVGGILAVRYGKARAKALAEGWVVPAWIAKRVLPAAKIARVREQFRAEINEQLKAQCAGLHAEFQDRIATIAEQQIEALSEITQL